MRLHEPVPELGDAQGFSLFAASFRIGELHGNHAFHVVPLVVGGGEVFQVMGYAMRGAQVSGFAQQGRPLGERGKHFAVAAVSSRLTSAPS